MDSRNAKEQLKGQIYYLALRISAIADRGEEVPEELLLEYKVLTEANTEIVNQLPEEVQVLNALFFGE